MNTYSVSHPTIYEYAHIVYDNYYKQLSRGSVDDLCDKVVNNMEKHNFEVAVIWNDDESIVLAKINRDDEGE